MLVIAAESKGGGWKGQGPTKDGRVKSFTDHEDSVYSEPFTGFITTGLT